MTIRSDATCRTCGIPIDAPAELESETCLPCQFVAMPIQSAVRQAMIEYLVNDQAIEGVTVPYDEATAIVDEVYREPISASEVWRTSADYDFWDDVASTAEPDELTCHSCGHSITPRQAREWDGVGHWWHRSCWGETYDGSESVLR